MHNSIGLLNIYSFKTLKKIKDTSFFPLRTLIAYTKDDIIDELEGWKNKRFIFVDEEYLGEDIPPKRIWEIWKNEFLKKKGIHKIKLNINLVSSDITYKDVEREIINMVANETNPKNIARVIYRSCIKETCPEEAFKNLVEIIAKRTLNKVFYNVAEDQEEIPSEKLESKIDLVSPYEEGDTIKLFVQRHRKWSEDIKGKDDKDWKEKDIYITLSGAMLGFNVMKNIKDPKDEIEMFKIAERFLYRVLIIDERVMKYIFDKGEENVENLRYSGINVGLIKVNKGGEEITCFNDKTLKDKIIGIIEGKDKAKYIPVIEVSDRGEITFLNLPEDFYDIAIIHISCLEKLAEEIKLEREEFIQRVVNSLKERVPNIFLTTGRGRINLKGIRDAKFVPFSIVNATLYRGFVDKILLIDSLSLVRGGIG